MAVRPTKDRGAAAQRGGERARVGVVADHRPVDNHLLLALAGPFDVSERNRAMRSGGDRVEQLLALDRVCVAAPLKRELAVVDAAGDVRRQHDRGVNGDRRLGGVRPSRLRRGKRKNGGDAKRQAIPQAAHLKPPPRPTRARIRAPGGNRKSGRTITCLRRIPLLAHAADESSQKRRERRSKSRTARKGPPLWAVRP